MSAISWAETSSDGDARTGIMSTPHGDVRTPNFMAVGTRATVKTVDTEDLERIGAQLPTVNRDYQPSTDSSRFPRTSPQSSPRKRTFTN